MPGTLAPAGQRTPQGAPARGPGQRTRRAARGTLADTRAGAPPGGSRASQNRNRDICLISRGCGFESEATQPQRFYYNIDQYPCIIVAANCLVTSSSTSERSLPPLEHNLPNIPSNGRTSLLRRLPLRRQPGPSAQPSREQRFDPIRLILCQTSLSAWPVADRASLHRSSRLGCSSSCSQRPHLCLHGVKIEGVLQHLLPVGYEHHSMHAIAPRWLR